MDIACLIDVRQHTTRLTEQLQENHECFQKKVKKTHALEEKIKDSIASLSAWDNKIYNLLQIGSNSDIEIQRLALVQDNYWRHLKGGEYMKNELTNKIQNISEDKEQLRQEYIQSATEFNKWQLEYGNIHTIKHVTIKDEMELDHLKLQYYQNLSIQNEKRSSQDKTKKVEEDISELTQSIREKELTISNLENQIEDMTKEIDELNSKINHNTRKQDLNTTTTTTGGSLPKKNTLFGGAHHTLSTSKNQSHSVPKTQQSNKSSVQGNFLLGTHNHGPSVTTNNTNLISIPSNALRPNNLSLKQSKK
ncbi:hypothetical protein SAMD00019534_010530 [Acytostelium subglobosum LB1]|uniref:hypothetical protein n=1 Tax=Acytostelium subglobosum LB1 TaxID=1410327 RepID=UPI000644AFC5|nr:hypothetical protein SAMD00019534_010530 [Acytostelium subglobosum LB1]GAM17878.1 hypothetical protein SAMD00019534_010530 [Acytostelium subglobosum LB1]|eukprot:XP_012758474.1 hypothetical protein SAMD00019534_010530 [Acytostelium subglobosum LB1]